MRVQVLGPLVVTDDRSALTIRGNELRLLAVLVAHLGEPVSADALIDLMWGDDPPRTAEKTLQAYVARLRRTLEPERERGAVARVLVTQTGGYALRVPRASVDAQHFVALADKGRRQIAAGAAALAAATLREALGLWRGPAYAGLRDLAPVQLEADRLEELRLAALEDRLDADERLGRHHEVVAEAERLLQDHPFRERLWSLRITALYRAGRQGEALATYQDARRQLAEELGIDPGPQLQRLHAQVLANDPELEAVPSGVVAPLPEELDRATPLVGRQNELRRLASAWDRAVRSRGGVLLLDGPAGAGKTRLVGELAQDAYRDGALVLYASCARGTDALRDALAAAGVDPAEDEGVVARVTGLVPDQPVLLVLDDLHRAAAALVRAVGDLALDATDARLLLVCCYDGEQAQPHLWSMVDRVDPARRARVRLGPLSERDVRAIVRLYVDDADAATATRAVWDDSEGVPERVHAIASAYARARALERIRRAADEAERTTEALAASESALVESLDALEAVRHRERTLADPRALRAGECPYKGLAAFESSDRTRFHGRERLVAELVARLAASSTLTLVGASGSGKSSVLQAGLLPALLEGVLPGLGAIRQVVVRPGEHPTAELARALGYDELDATALVDVLVQEPTVLVVDQLEELFTSAAAAEAELFATVLDRVAQGPLAGRLVLAIRSDFYEQLTQVSQLARWVSRNQVIVPPLQREELRRVVTRPAQQAGATVEPALVEGLVEAVAGQPGALPVLSTCLVELWERRHGQVLRPGHLAAIGGVQGAVARLAERAYGGLDDRERERAPDVLLRLVAAGEADSAVRRRACLDELDVDTDPVSARVVRHLVAARLLTAEGEHVEIAHESLIREWPRLREWIAEAETGRRVHEHVRQAASDWDAAGRDPVELYRGARLAAAWEWYEADPRPAPNELERAFLHASRDAAEQQRLQRRRRLQVVVGGLTTAVAVLLALSLIALLLNAKAGRERDVAASRAVAAESLNQLDVDPQLGLLLALEAYRIRPTDEAVAALRRAVVSAHLRRVLPGNAGVPFAQVRFSPDGTLVATGGLQGAQLWDVANGHRLALLREGAKVTDVAFSPDGRQLLTGVLAPGTSHVWDVRSRRVVGAVPGSRAAQGIDLVRWLSPTRGLAAGVDGTVRLWDERAARPGLVIPGHVGYGLDAGAGVLVTGGTDGVARVWDAEQGRLLRSWRAARGRVNCVALAPGGRSAATCGDDGIVELRDVRSGRLLHRMAGHRSAALVARFTPDGRLLVTGDSLGELRVWRVGDGSTDRVLVGHTDAIFPSDLALNATGSLLASGSADGTARVWDLRTGQSIGQFVGQPGRVESVTFSPDGRAIASASDEGARIWATPEEATAVVATNDGGVLEARTATGAPRIASAGLDGTVRVLDLRTGRPVSTLRAPSGTWLRGAALSADGRTVVAVSSFPVFARPWVWDVASRRLLERIPIPARVAPRECLSPDPCPLSDVAISPTAPVAAIARLDGALYAWDLRTHRLQALGDLGTAAVRVQWSPDGRLVVGTDIDGTAHLYDARTHSLVRVLKGHQGQGGGAAFTSDGRYLATTSYDATARIWDVRTGVLVTSLRHRSKVLDAAFSPDGRFLVTASGNAPVLWDVASGRVLTQFPGHSGEIAWVEFLQDGRIMSASDDGTVRFFRCPVCGSVDQLVAQARRLVVRELTPAERARYLP